MGHRLLCQGSSTSIPPGGHMTLGAYIAATEDHQHLAWMRGSVLDILIDSAVTDGQVLIMTAESSEGSGVPVHVHSNEDEIFVLLEGSLIVWVGTERREVAP